MKTLRRPRIVTRINVLHDDATVYLLDNTKPRKRRLPAVCMATIRDRSIVVGEREYSLPRQYVNSFTGEVYNTPDHHTDLFPYSKLSRMIVKAINKGKTFTYRDIVELPALCLNFTPAEETADIDQQFRKRQRESIKRYAKQTAQSLDQAEVLQVA